MPSGGNTPLSNDDMDAVWEDYEAAKRNGLVYEWMQYFIGGITYNNLPVKEASRYACIEWDF